MVPEDLFIVKLSREKTKQKKIVTLGGTYRHTHRHMDTQTNIPRYRPKRSRRQVSVVGIKLHTD